MDVRLRVISGPFAGQTISLTAPKYLIGRERDCHLRPDSEFISRHHCVLLLDDFTLRVRDMGSKNGTLVNNQRIHGDVVLGHDDLVTVGDMTLHVCIERDAPTDSGKPSSSETDTTNDPAAQGTTVFDGNTVSTTADESARADTSTSVGQPAGARTPSPNAQSNPQPPSTDESASMSPRQENPEGPRAE